MAVFEPVILPEAMKEQLCRELLAEFGVDHIRHRPTQQELTHACLVNPDQHSDQARNPTASLNYAKLTYKCLGCNAQGGILWLIKELRQCEHQEAREWLASRTGTGDHLMGLSQLLEFYDALYDQRSHRPAPIPTFSERVLEPWLGIVHPWLTEGVPDLEIEGRGIPEQTVIDMKIGWDETDDTIVIPHFWKGQLVGWQKRRLSGSGPKYESTEDMPKDQTLYDYDPKRTYAVIVESPMSVLKHRHVLPMEATFGASVTDRQIKLISAHYERCVLWMDNDKGGWQALEGIGDSPGMIERLEPYCSVWVVDSPFAGDPADLPSDVAAEVVELCAKPASLWKRPRFLSCPRCGNQVHTGACEPEERSGDAA